MKTPICSMYLRNRKKSYTNRSFKKLVILSISNSSQYNVQTGKVNYVRQINNEVPVAVSFGEIFQIIPSQLRQTILCKEMNRSIPKENLTTIEV